MEYYGVIYQGELKGNLYVGQHVNNSKYSLEARWRDHAKPNSGCIKFRNAIQKHGKDKIVWSIIAYCKVGGQDRLDAMERYFIKKRNSLSPNGYNLEKGGHGGVPCEETKQKMSEAMTKRYEDPKEREKISEAMLIYYAENPEAREKNSESKLKYYAENPGAREKNSQAKLKYYAENPEARLKNSEAVKKYYAETPGAREKNSESKKNYFAENPEAVMRGENHPMFGRTGAEHPKSKKICQYERDGETFVKEWDSMADAYRDLGIHCTNIGDVCRGIQKTAGGFVWRYAD